MNTSEAAAEQRAEYMRTYRKANRERLSAYQRAYYHAHREKRAAYQRANRERIAEQQRAYYQAHREQIAERKRNSADLCPTCGARLRTRYVITEQGRRVLAEMSMPKCKRCGLQALPGFVYGDMSILCLPCQLTEDRKLAALIEDEDVV